MPPRTVAVAMETGARLSFASALDWPGWARSGRGDDAALRNLTGYAPRYSPVAEAAGLEPPDPEAFEVVEHLSGSATTDFGAPEAIAAYERTPLSSEDAARLLDIAGACWSALDRIAAAAPHSLRKGPRGGGRDRDAILTHVLAAEVGAYARKIGLRIPAPQPGDAAALSAERTALVSRLRALLEGEGDSTSWPPRYAVRRIAWHVLDHAWEIEDRSHR